MKHFCILAVCLSVAIGPCAAQISVVGGEPARSEQVWTENDPIQATILLQGGDRRNREVSADTTFFEGQRFRIRLSSNLSGYLYVLCANSQGSAQLLYPNIGSDATNHIAVGRKTMVPERDWFQFDNEPGVEQIFVVLSPRPIPSLEQASQRGGEISLNVLARYADPVPSENDDKGISRENDNIVIRRINLQHETR
jgi:hypothetical protein